MQETRLVSQERSEGFGNRRTTPNHRALHSTRCFVQARFFATLRMTSGCLSLTRRCSTAAVWHISGRNRSQADDFFSGVPQARQTPAWGEIRGNDANRNPRYQPPPNVSPVRAKATVAVPLLHRSKGSDNAQLVLTVIPSPPPADEESGKRQLMFV